jgi:carbonic anhydrase/acetyltransferase-like protein (isoleucine patch superfamily)
MIYDLGEDKVQTVGDNYFVAPNASVIGRVSLGLDTSVWFGVVIRGDNDSITIGDRSNIQDGSVFHVDAGAPTLLGNDVCVGHSATVHGCIVGSGTLVGMGATILSNAVIGKNSIVGAEALVTEHKEFPDRSVIVGSPARRIREITAEELKHIQWIADHYVARGKRYRAELKARD